MKWGQGGKKIKEDKEEKHKNGETDTAQVHVHMELFKKLRTMAFVLCKYNLFF